MSVQEAHQDREVDVTVAFATGRRRGAGAADARMLAVDLARSAALLGMVVVNVGPRDDDGPAAWAIRAAHGRAAVLFVVLAGLGVGLLLSSGRTRGTVSLLMRGAVLLVGGLALQLLDHDVSVILPTYAALFAVAVMAGRAPDRLLLAGAVSAMFLGPLAWTLAQVSGEFPMTAPSLGDGPGQVLIAVLLTGPYPVITWVAPFLLGIWLGRQRLDDPPLRRRMLVVGLCLTAGAAGAALVSDAAGLQPVDRLDPARFLIATAHSQMPLWLLTATGSALVLLACALAVAPRVARSRVAGAVASLGRASLTSYVAHLLVIALLVRPGPTTAAAGLAVSATFALAALVATTVWSRRFRRGPLEELLRTPERLLVRHPAASEPPAHVAPTPPRRPHESEPT